MNCVQRFEKTNIYQGESGCVTNNPAVKARLLSVLGTSAQIAGMGLCGDTRGNNTLGELLKNLKSKCEDLDLNSALLGSEECDSDLTLFGYHYTFFIYTITSMHDITAKLINHQCELGLAGEDRTSGEVDKKLKGRSEFADVSRAFSAQYAAIKEINPERNAVAHDRSVNLGDKAEVLLTVAKPLKDSGVENERLNEDTHTQVKKLCEERKELLSRFMDSFISLLNVVPYTSN